MVFTFRKQLQQLFSKELQYGIKHYFNVSGHGKNRITEIWDQVQTQVSNLQL